MTTRTAIPLVKNCVEGCQHVAFRCMGVLLFAVVFAPCTVAKAATEGDFNYETDGTTITITGYTGAGGAVTIPDMIAGLPVASIGDSAFSWCTSLRSVTIGDSVTSVGDGAFRDCTSLKSVTIGDSVTSIGQEAFYASALTSVTIPDSVTSIGNSAFRGCDGLKSVTIGDSVTSIGDGAFCGCTGLTSVRIPDSVTSIGAGAFGGCSRLAAITVEALNPAYSGLDGVLFNKTQDTLVEFPGGRIGAYAVPNSVTSIGQEAFFLCTGLKSVTIGNSVTNIGQEAFYLCDLKSVTIGDSVTSIGPQAFEYCIGLTNVAIPNSVTSIGDYAFAYCSGLTNVTIGNSVTTIGPWAFCGCTGLTSVAIPDSVTSIGNSAFRGCDGLTSVTIGKSVTTIGSYTFYGCSRLKGAFFKGNTPTSAGPSVFDNAPYVTVYYRPGTVGWGTGLAGRPAVLWDPVIPSFGPRANGFGFRITGTSNIPVVVEGCTNLSGGAWVPLKTASLTNGFFDFTDPRWTNYAVRFYRVRSP